MEAALQSGKLPGGAQTAFATRQAELRLACIRLGASLAGSVTASSTPAAGLARPSAAIDPGLRRDGLITTAGFCRGAN